MLTWQNMVGWFTNAIKHPQVRVRDDGSPVYEYQPRLGESKGNFNQVVVDTDHWGCLLARRYGGDSVQEGKGSGQCNLDKSQLGSLLSQPLEPSWHR